MPITERMAFVYRGEAPGAIPNGARVRKINSEPSDGHPDGSLGIVLGSLSTEGVDISELAKHPPYSESKYAYFIEWDAHPDLPVGTLSAKVEMVDG